MEQNTVNTGCTGTSINQSLRPVQPGFHDRLVWRFPQVTSRGSGRAWAENILPPPAGLGSSDQLCGRYSRYTMQTSYAYIGLMGTALLNFTAGIAHKPAYL